MKHLGTIEGTGRLSADGQDFGEVRYSIEIHMNPAGITEGTGRIWDGPTIGEATFANRELTLTLEGQEAVKIRCQRLSFPDGYADIVVNGPVPGF